MFVILLCKIALAPAYLLAFNKFSWGTLCPQHDFLVSQLLVFDFLVPQLLVFDSSLPSIGSRLNTEKRKGKKQGTPDQDGDTKAHDKQEFKKTMTI